MIASKEAGQIVIGVLLVTVVVCLVFGAVEVACRMLSRKRMEERYVDHERFPGD